MSLAPAVKVEGVWKSFLMPEVQVHTLKERVLHPFRRPTDRELGVLQDINFEVGKGEFFAIVGRNGSGKSTLLKCLAGIYATDRGRISVDGTLSSFIELGVGFNPDLPARDNVELNAMMLGLSRREARSRFDAVIDFAELQDFVDLKLKNYSSGMMVRLAFAVMVQVDAQVVLIDEVLAVGDAAFQQKCFDQFAGMRNRGKTVVLVTHDMAAAQRFGDRGMLIEAGVIEEIGDVQKVAGRYLEVNFGDHRRALEPADEDAADAVQEPDERYGDGLARVLDAWFEDEDGTRTTVLPTGRPCTHVQRVKFSAAAFDPVFSMTIDSPNGATMITADKGILVPTGGFAAGEEVEVRTSFVNLLAPDRYLVTPGVAHAGNMHFMDRPLRLQVLTVTGERKSAGILELPFEVDVRPVPTPEAIP